MSFGINVARPSYAQQHDTWGEERPPQSPPSRRPPVEHSRRPRPPPIRRIAPAGNERDIMGGSLGIVQISTSQELDEAYFGCVISLSAANDNVHIILPKVEPSNVGKSMIFRRVDGSTIGTRASIRPAGDDTIEAGSPDGAWIPHIGRAIGIGFGDTMCLCSNGNNGWFFLFRPNFCTLTSLTAERTSSLTDLDRTVIVRGEGGGDRHGQRTVVILPTACGKGGRTLVIKTDPISFSHVIVEGKNGQTIDGNRNFKLHPGWALSVVSDDENWYITNLYTPTA